jgi:hypothetical protein
MTRIPEQELADLEARAEAAEKRCERLLAALRRLEVASREPTEARERMEWTGKIWCDYVNKTARSAIAAAEQGQP